METPKEYYYTYYSYEEWGRGYFGSRGCKCLPEEDVKYLGSSKDKTFKPTQKIILKDDYTTREEAIADEIILHDYYDVANNPHFANKSKATSTGFYVSREDASKNGRKSYELGLGAHARTKEQKIEHNKKLYELGVGIHGITKEQMIKHGRKSYELGIGVHALTAEQRIQNGRNSGRKVYELGLGIHALTIEKRSENAIKGGTKSYELGVGVHGLTLEEKVEIGRKTYELGLGIHGRTKEQRQETAKKVASQKWQCAETGHITNAGALTNYQRKRGIDTTKRIRIE